MEFMKQEKKQIFKITETKTTQLSMNCVLVALRLCNQYSLLLRIRGGFPEEVTGGESHSAWILFQKVSLPLVSPNCN